MTVAIIVGTFGPQSWADLATKRAIPSAEVQVPCSGAVHVIHVHGKTLAQARNVGAAQCPEAEWLIFLDGDDELAPGYVEAILKGEGDLRTPAVSWVSSREPHATLPPQLLEPKDLRHGNYLIIGTAVRREFFELVGGFQEWTLYEDWAMFLRCWLAGAEVGQVPEAVYRAWVREGSRNEPSRNEKLTMLTAIRMDSKKWAVRNGHTKRFGVHVKSGGS